MKVKFVGDFKEIDAEKFENFNLKQSWQLTEANNYDQLPSPFNNKETFAVYFSGTCNIDDYRNENGIEDIIAGVDWVKNETNKKPNEPDLNVYHFVFIKNQINGKIYMSKPQREGARVIHWPSYDDLIKNYDF